jgi:MGT family glycosyltransferase
MARFLILTFPLAGHVNPAIPIVRKLIEHGHEVLWITGRIFRERVEATGARYRLLPDEIDPGDKELYDLFPQLVELKGWAQVQWYVKHVFLDSSRPMIKAIDHAMQDYPADILIGNSVAPGVFYKSEISNIPSVMFSDTPFGMMSRDTAPSGLGITPGRTILKKLRNRLLNFLVYNLLSRDINRYATALYDELGLKPTQKPGNRGYYENPALKLILQFSTAAFEYPLSDLPDTFHFIGPIVPEPVPDYPLPHWWPELNTTRPVVLINQGTVANNMEDIIVPATLGLRHEDMLVIAVPVPTDDLTEMPDNVRTESFIPFGNILPHVDIMITNGGYGATQMALAHGIPVVIAGATEDKMEVAGRVEWSGCGINLRKKRPSSRIFLDAVREILGNKSYRDNARRFQDEVLRSDAPAKAVALLENLVDEQKGGNV